MPFPRSLTGLHNTTINAVALRVAGRGSLAVLEHVGRVSGVVRRTPLRAFRSERTVVIGLNFGRESDWLKNLQAAGHGRMLLRDEVLELGAPRVLPLAEGAEPMPAWFRWGLRHVARTVDCAELPILSTEPAGG